MSSQTIGTTCPSSRKAQRRSKFSRFHDVLVKFVANCTRRTQVGKFRVRLVDASVSILLNDGYDWQRTRKVIEDEIKAVRRKLEKIRQLLASGQKASEPIQNSRSILFNSVYIGLDEQREDLDSSALLAAIDEELDELATADTASQSSWQTDFPPGQGVKPRAKDKSHRTRLRGKRLTRSKKPQMEIDLQRINLDLDIYGDDEPTASRVGISVGSMEILDHIKTSTWKKFLTEMKSDARGNIRETDAEMVRVELVSVRPSLAQGNSSASASARARNRNPYDPTTRADLPDKRSLGQESRLKVSSRA